MGYDYTEKSHVEDIAAKLSHCSECPNPVSKCRFQIPENVPWKALNGGPTITALAEGQAEVPGSWLPHSPSFSSAAIRRTEPEK